MKEKSQKDCSRACQIRDLVKGGAHLSDEDVEFISEWTMGDMIVHCYMPLEDAIMVKNFVKSEKVRLRVPGFKTQIKEGFIVECSDMCRMAGIEPEEDYHPQENEHGGIKFEDSGPGEQTGMIKSNLQSIASKAQSLHDTIGDMDQLPEWVQEKIAVADEMIDTISDYLQYEYARAGKGSRPALP